ncbi:iron-containing alcohol dehydrogenase [Pseudomonas monteilii]|nr:iron-containing alcohol dehydrogenase [Pseudomonas monteilii]
MNKPLRMQPGLSAEQVVYGSELLARQDDEALSYVICPDLFAHGMQRTIVDDVLSAFKRVFLVVDANIGAEKIQSVQKHFSGKATCDSVLHVEGGEQVKNFDEVVRILDWLDRGGFVRRSDVVVLVGGGSVLDLGSFASSIYRRGVDHIRVPTTLLGLVDAGIGVKSAINFNGNKNRIGSYQRPTLSIIDPGLIDTHDVDQIRNGLCEIIKAAIIGCRELFNEVHSNRHELLKSGFYGTAAGISIIRRSIDVLLREIAANPEEQALRRSMDFGHILSPLLEANSEYRMPHGLAVVKEVVFCCRYSVRQGYLTNEQMGRIEALLTVLDIPYEEPLFEDPGFMREAIAQAVRHRQGMLHLPIPRALGIPCFVEQIDDLMERSC